MAGERVLVCDDGRESRDFIVEYILQPNNYEALIARNGVECLEIAREYHPDLILLDLQMPKMNGMQVLEALKSEKLEIPVILMTFHGSEEIAIEVYRMGVQDYVKKPFDIDEMQRAIQRTLNEVRLRKEKEELTDRLISANSDMNQRIREFTMLHNVGKALTGILSLDELLPRVVRAAIELTESDACSLYLLQGEELVCRAIKTATDPQIRLIQQSVNDPFAWRAIQMGKPFAVSPSEMETHRNRNPNLPRAVLGSPLATDERVLGALSVSNSKPDTKGYRKQDSPILNTLADYAAVAIENAAHFMEQVRIREREVAKVRAVLEKYVSPALADQIVAGELPQPKVTASQVGVLLATIKGHEAYVDTTDAAQLASVLNQQLGTTVQIITNHGGTVEKYLGDGLIAYFNFPETNPNYAIGLIQAAWVIQQTLHEQEIGLSFSIGLHIGRAIVGNIGAMPNLGIAAVGEMISVVQRLHEKAPAGKILATEDLVNEVGEKRIQATYLGQIPAPGRQQRINVYEILKLN